MRYFEIITEDIKSKIAALNNILRRPDTTDIDRKLALGRLKVLIARLDQERGSENNNPHFKPFSEPKLDPIPTSKQPGTDIVRVKPQINANPIPQLGKMIDVHVEEDKRSPQQIIDDAVGEIITLYDKKQASVPIIRGIMRRVLDAGGPDAQETVNRRVQSLLSMKHNPANRSTNLHKSGN